MIVDAGALPENRGVSCDVCIVGSGPAGLTLARELSGRELRVCVLESGSFEVANSPTRSLSELESEGNFVQVTPDSRNRRFGGNASFWGVHLPHTVSGVRLIPFLPSDFDRREGVPYSGWPFSREYLEPYYARAQKFMGAGPYRYGLSSWEGPESPALPLGRNLQTAMFMFGNGQQLTQDYRQELERSTTTTVYCSSNAVELETDESGDWVRRVRVATVQGQQFWVDAKFVLLAAGGVENAQLLLVSNKVHQKGLGNAHDLVGRFFMDHPIAHGGYIFVKDRTVFERAALYDKRSVDGVSAMGGILLSDAVVREQGLLNLTSWLFPRPMWSARAESMEALRRFARGKSFAKGASGAWSDLKSALSGGRAVLDGAYNKLTRVPQPVWPNLADGDWHAQQARKHRAFGVFEVLHLLEQAPDPENRIMLGEGIDVLGRRKAYLRSSWREIDQRGVDYGQKLLDQGLRAAGIGYFEPERRDGELIWSSHGASHHIGTARMAESPRDGVVDEHGKVHGVNNLYVAGSATFPTGSSLNPTLTIVALAARMADRVRALLERDHDVSTSSSAPSAASASVTPLDVGASEAVAETSSH